MLFHQVNSELQGSAALLRIIVRVLNDTPKTKEGIKTLMDYIESEDVIVQYRVFKEAQWHLNRPLYEACKKYELDRFTQISIGLKNFIQGPMTEFVKNRPIHGRDNCTEDRLAYLYPVVDAMETAFWLGLTSADL